MPDDTIVAIATPPGRGGLGVVRLSGPRARAIGGALVSGATDLPPRQATFTRVLHAGAAIDHAVTTFFPAPASYTGEDVIEISAHGSPVLLHTMVSDAVAEGARLARPGEFTLRAFLNGRMDLVQAEAVNDLIAASTPLQARAAFDQLDGTLTTRLSSIDERLLDLVSRLEASLDFPDEGYEFIAPAVVAEQIAQVEGLVAALTSDGRKGRLLREGATVAIVGRPNVGKSSLFNRLAGADRAIVHAAPGTTRDLITEVIDLDGAAVTLVDTAGIREAEGAIEAEGVRRARASATAAQLALVVLDASDRPTDDDRALLEQTRSQPRVVVGNKSDLSCAWAAAALPDDLRTVRVSATTGEGLDDLRRALAAALGAGELREGAAITNVRHLALLDRTAAALARARAAARAEAHEELVLVDLHEARHALEDVTGRRSSDDLLNEIFSRFCVGK